MILDGTAPPPQKCFPSGEPVEGAWKEVAEDFRRTNAGAWSLTSALAPGLPHVSVRRGDVVALFASKGVDSAWRDFNKLHQDSMGYIEVSAVGFNRTHTKAMVYVLTHAATFAAVARSIFWRSWGRHLARGQLKGSACRWSC